MIVPLSPVVGHPRVSKAAIFDIITRDLGSGLVAAGAEIIAVANNCLNSFPNLCSTKIVFNLDFCLACILPLGNIGINGGSGGSIDAGESRHWAGSRYGFL